MKRILILLVGFIFFGICLANGATPPWKTTSPQGDYIIIGWNDLGMHCINPSYAELALLTPFNNLWVQVIQRGDPPKDRFLAIRLPALWR